MNNLINSNFINVLNDSYIMDEIKTVEECERALEIEYKRKEEFESKGIVLVKPITEFTMTSLEVTELVNKLRLEEGNKKVKRHSDFMASVATEVNSMINAGIKINERNISLVEYTDKKGEKRPCYILDKSFIMQMLNKESAYVRYKTQEYIEKLEQQVKKLSTPSYAIEDEMERYEAYGRELYQRKYENCLSNIKLLEEKKIRLINEPKAKWFDKFMNSEGTYTSSDFAKIIGFSSAQKLNKKLNEIGICFKRSGKWMPYANVNNEWISFTPFINQTNGYSDTQLKFTPKGIYEISKLLGVELKEEDIARVK